MSLLAAESVTQTFGTHDVLLNASFRLGDADRIGLVGPNGEGKTTLMRVLIGSLKQTSGRVDRKRDLRVGYLPQDPPDIGEMTLHEALLDVFADLRKIEHELGELAGKLDSDSEALDRFGRLQTEFDAMGGHSYVHRIEAVLTGLGFHHRHWDKPLDQFSGGERTRALLGRLLLEEPELLLLDEPTNHLDVESVEWLERWLQSYRGALVVVSHDRYFLDRTTDNTWEIAFGSLETYRGSYSQYLAKREARYKERLSQFEAQHKHIATTQDFIRRNLAGQRTKEAQGRRKRLERFIKTEAIAKPREHPRIHLRFAALQRSGEIVLRAAGLQAGYEKDAPLLAADQLEIQRGWRVAIVGANGIGKTTLLRTLMGDLEPLAGTAIWGANVQMGYLSQTHAELQPTATVLESLRQADTDMSLDDVRSLAGRLLFAGDDALKIVSELSGGQRSRLLLGRVMAQKANVLLLDEPTNHLDIPSQEILQSVLDQFDGTVIFVSHDRYLIDALATHVWALDGERVAMLPGGWDEYVQWRNRTASSVPTGDDGKASAKVDGKAAHQERRRRRNALQRLGRRLKEVEKLVHDHESDLERIGDEITHAGEQGQLDDVSRLGEDYQRIETELQTLLGEWEQISEELEALEEK